MPDPRPVAGPPLAGLFGKVPAHGDFVRRGLPSSFVTPWDEWLQAAVAAARAQLGARWEDAWDNAPAWRFALPAGACGPDAVAGVMLPSQDQVGRRFPITLAALLPPGASPPDPDWFDAVEAAALAGLAGHADADALSAALPLPGTRIAAMPFVLPSVPTATGPTPAAGNSGWEAAATVDDPIAPAEDVLALLGAAGPAAAPDGAGEDDALARLMGGPAAPDAATAPDGTLAGLLGMSAQTADDADPPQGFVTMPDQPGLSHVAAEATLADLIGAAPDPGPTGAGFAATAPPAPADDGVLAALIGAAASEPPAGDLPPEPGVAAPLLALIGGAAEPAGVEAADLLPETVPMGWPDLAEPTADDMPAGTSDLPLAAPPAPEGGGWWTRGGAHVPPMVWPLPGLPAPADFAYLLEAAA
jgi:type VI secretion system protein ImpM